MKKKSTEPPKVYAPEPLSKQDLERLRECGDALAKSLKELGDENMIESTKQLRRLQWYDSVQSRIYAWEQYIRFLERDGVLAQSTRDSVGKEG